MKTVYLSIAMAAAALSFASCTMDDNVLSNEPQSGPFEITITGEMGGFETSTKSSVESVIRMKWNTTEVEAEKDVVYVYGSVDGPDDTMFKSLGSLKATSSEGNPYTATLSGTITEMPKDGNLYLVHFPSGTYSEPAVLSDGSVTIDMSAVEQGSDVTPFIIYSTVRVSETALSGLTARFSFATTVVKVNLTGLEAGAVLTQATVSGLNKTCSLSFSEGVVTVSAAAAAPAAGDLGTFTKALSGTATASGNATFLLGVPAMSAVSDRQLTVTAGGKTYTDDGVFPGAHSANSYVNTICCLVPEESLLLPGRFTVSSSGRQVQFTKGNLYYSTTDSKYHIEAEQNVTYATLGQSSYDATHVCHFYWSNTTDWQTSGKEPWAESYSYSSQSTSDKFFCGVGNPMTVDGQDSLYTLTGGDYGEWNYLITGRDNASSLHKYGVSVTTGAGTTNCLVIAPDGYIGTIADSYDAAAWATAESSGLVCLPIAGYRNGSDLGGAGLYSNYWAATLHENNNTYAYCLTISSNGKIYPVDYTARSSCLSVRLVKKVAEFNFYPGTKYEGIKIGDVTWAPVNCGYDAEHTYGLLYQWGRQYGQDYEPETITPVYITKEEGQWPEKSDKFGKYRDPYSNWFNGIDNTLWPEGSRGTYDPCPSGWRVPTKAEFNALISNKAWGNNTVGTVSQTGYWFNGSSTASEGTGVFLPAAGYRYYYTCNACCRGVNGCYWSSSVDGDCAWHLFFNDGRADMSGYVRAYGHSVRCVKE